MRDNFERILAQEGQTGLYESHYLRGVSPDGRAALWLKYCILRPAVRGARGIGEFWAAVWLSRGAPPVVVKRALFADQLLLSDSQVRLSGGGMALGASSASGHIESGGHSVAWDLTYSAGGQPLFHFPYEWLYTLPFPKKKIITPAPRIVLAGTLDLDGQALSLDGWTGLRGHNWGKEHAHEYAYGNCTEFDGLEGVTLDGFSARIKVARMLSPWISVLVGELDAAPFAINEPRRWLATSRVEFPVWSYECRSESASAKLTWSAKREDFAGLRYLHPSGLVSYCYNTKFASLRGEISRGQRRVKVQSDRAELEFLSPTPRSDVPLVGDSSLMELEASATRAGG